MRPASVGGQTVAMVSAAPTMKRAAVLAAALAGSTVAAYEIEHVVVLVMENRPFGEFND